MADTATLPPTATSEVLVPTDDGAGDRGSLEISPRAIERIAEVTALRAAGVLRQAATFGRGLPRAKAQLAGQRVQVGLEIAVEWGYPLAELAAEVRGRLTHTITTLTGLGVDSVSVDISAVELPTTGNRATSPRRVA
ncbi:Asp23/Gls24 family envelope stress response protein [Kribbella sp. CA-293567]|uniref:Asp23/Gls24 family envelope stress response protein n=1 Tax=Kribbella sp. CA-293567 TaxID=3002436 RepID=UPI0022DDF019|nr:Asp23/Gls24 family envelope stress response protein [Kribbella sp. CA-293567]WBQ03881.1 Asp23/Gls24 family envelope stress response protein [Kribbella sp. CA-293567]